MKLRFDRVIDDHAIHSTLSHIQMDRLQFIFDRNYRQLHAPLFLIKFRCDAIELNSDYIPANTYDNTFALEIDASQAHNLMGCISVKNEERLVDFLLAFKN